MKKIISLFFVFTLVVFLSSQSLVLATYTDVSVSEAKQMIDTNPGLVILDVRTQEEYNESHIQNAVLIPVNELESRLDELDKEKETLVYCRSGGRSATASQILADNGFSNVYNMLGGITAWTDGGYLVYVKYSSIQAAINNANEGDTLFVSSGVYYEHLVVNKSLNLQGENKETTIIDGSGTGKVVTMLADRVNITSFKIQNSGSSTLLPEDAGICLHGANYTTISDCILTSNGINGLHFYNSSHNTIEKCDISYTEYPEPHHYGKGIGLIYSVYNTIINCSIYSNSYGIHLDWESSGNSIISNTVTNNSEHGIYVHQSNSNNIFVNTVSNNSNHGIWIDDSGNNSIAGNTVTGNTQDGIRLYYSFATPLNNKPGNNSITGNKITNNSDGIVLSSSCGNHIAGNNITENTEQGAKAISLINSLSNTISGNNVIKNYDGIFLGNSENNTIVRNNITENSYDGISLELNSSNNTISDNKLTKNMFAIRVGSSFNNIISGNNITENNASGIALYESSSYNTITRNDIIRNSQGGIWLASSSNNTIYHNNFVDTTSQAYNEDSTNVWDNGYPSGGNYWSDYNQLDEYQGSEQNIPGSDGIGDTPYVIDENNQDNYPLMELWKLSILGDVNGDGIVDIFDVVLATLAFGSTPLDSNWNQAADLNNDGIVDIFDVVLLAQNFGKTV